jgi:5'-nucleotidase
MNVPRRLVLHLRTPSPPSFPSAPSIGSVLFAILAIAGTETLPCGSRVSLQAQAPFRILVTNDDGVRAPGILALAQALAAIGEVTVVAPSENQSGKGHSLSITDPVYVDSVSLPGGLNALAATATPASCVKLALLALLKERPNLVVSGINRGYNLGMTAYVSGTVGAAREAALQGIPAIASSMHVTNAWNDYTAAAKFTTQVAEMVKKDGLAPGVFINMNIPTGMPKGMRVTTQSQLMGEEKWVEHTNPRGRRYFWNDYRDSEKDVPGTDVALAAEGYVTVVTLKAGEYDAAASEKLKGTIK